MTQERTSPTLGIVAIGLLVVRALDGLLLRLGGLALALAGAAATLGSMGVMGIEPPVLIGLAQCALSLLGGWRQV